MMRPWSVLALLFAAGSLAVTAARADDKADATGTWTWSYQGQDGQSRETTLKLKQDGSKLTGTVSGRNNTETPIEDGKVDGSEVSFRVTRERNGNKFTQKYRGTLDGSTIKGKVEMPGRDGGEARTRDWEAKRS